ncbi:MAG: tRNA (N(6)-L-threonylcarbamoyladenosine(37)-C(2))-methylthiotransferase MtaB [Deltaproteobacteria bacterium]
MKKVAFYTLGCKVNQYETQAMTEMFQQAGYEVVDFEGFADVYVINTCTVTSFGDKKSRQIIRRANRINPEAVIAVAGCYSQTSPEETSKIKGVSVVVGTKNRNKIVEFVEEAFNGKKHFIVSDIMKQREYEENGFISFSETTRAFVKIQEGCQEFCSYCIIPFARGAVRSRLPENVIKEINKLADNGFKEVVLTGININSYGKDIEGVTLLGLLEKITEREGIKRIRLGSLNPDLITESFVTAIMRNEKICPHFHISLQSGSDSTLKRMNRKYSTSDYQNRIELLRKNIPDVSITTDIMVGFPGETEKEFEATYDFLNNISLTKLHVFKYSPRKGTPAASFGEQITPQEKEKRSDLLLELSNKKEKEFYEKYLSKEVEVFFEQETEGENRFSEGHTGNFIKVVVPNEMDLTSGFARVKVEKVENGFVRGVVLKKLLK